jgi:hypothetical protein
LVWSLFVSFIWFEEGLFHLILFWLFRFAGWLLWGVLDLWFSIQQVLVLWTNFGSGFLLWVQWVQV